MKKIGELGISPPPWRTDYDFWIVDADGYLVFTNSSIEQKQPGTHANARLIAAVPKLYEALRAAVIEMCHACPSCVPERGFGCDNREGVCFVQRWRAALAEAAGESEADND